MTKMTPFLKCQHTCSHACKSSGINLLAGFARALDRTVLALLKHPGGRGGVNQRSHRNVSVSLPYSFFVSVFLTLWLPLFFPLPLVLLKHIQTYTHARQHSVQHRQLLPGVLTGVTPPRHPPCRGIPDRPVPLCSPFLPPVVLPFLFIGSLTHSQSTHQRPIHYQGCSVQGAGGTLKSCSD